MKKTAIILIFALLASLVAGIQAVEVARANFFMEPYVTLHYPVSWTVYTNTSVPLDIEASVSWESPEIVRFLYSLDRSSNVTLTSLTKTGIGGGYEFHTVSVLENLAEGNHTIKVYSQDASGGEMSGSVEFIIDTHFNIPLLVMSPQNITYFTIEVPLTFVCSEEIMRIGNTTMTYYWLDGYSEYISGNLTLTDLSIGSHSIVVTVWTEKGVFSETIYFSIATQTSTPSPTPIVAPTPTPIDVNFVVQEYFGAFSGSRFIGSFHASPGDSVELDLTALSSDGYKREVQVQIQGANSGVVYDAVANNFFQTIQISSDDSYNITVIKRSPFYSDLTVSGEIIVHYNSGNQTTPTPSQNPNPQPQPFPAPLVFVASVGIALAAIGLLVYPKKRQKTRSE